ncbi:MAG TPA: putative sulfate exporter family transporter [Arachnia sp.]|nr:putative sulfate exporter family transporter [Arachnia sp.]HMT86516.1 putative sulfate exporter family transporter [Arachnia sp.]
MSQTDIDGADKTLRVEQPSDDAPPAAPPAGHSLPWAIGGLAVVLALGIAAFALTEGVPQWTEATAFGAVASTIEYPVYAIILGLLGNLLLSALGVREKLSPGFRTEFLIKTGLVLLGASINFALIVRAAGPAILQATLLITIVFFSTWWVAGKFGLDDKLRALLASAVSICGVSAAIAAAGAVKAKKEHLAYTASLVILFALPSIFLLPWLAGVLGLGPAATGAWIGGNIDTTAAVTAAGAIAGEGPLQIAAIVKSTQNALLGVAAVLLTLYFALSVERKSGEAAPTARAFWDRFPKFVLGFLVASVVATIFANTVPAEASKAAIGVANDLRGWFLIFAFVSIGLEFNVKTIREAGWRPVAVFSIATLTNLVVGLGLAVLLWSNFEL